MDGHRMTAGFYKVEDGQLLYGPNYVLNNEWALWKEEKDFYLENGVLPYEGWHWFDSEEEARAALIPEV